MNKKFWKDLFYGPGNEHADLGRVIAGIANLAMLSALIWNISLGLPIEIDKLGIGFAAVETALAALIYAKDRAKAENTVATAIKEEVKK